MITGKLSLFSGCVALVIVSVFGLHALAQLDPEKIQASDGAAGDRFGYAVDVGGEVLLVGADFDDPHGSAYVFRREGAAWVEETKLVPSGTVAGWECAASVAIDGDVAVLGCRNDRALGERAGATRVYRRDGSDWVEEAKLLASDGAAHDQFGVDVDVWGDRVLVGAFQVYSGGPGAAYVFHRNGTRWVEEAKLVASDGEYNDLFGLAVALSDDIAVIGAWHDDDQGQDSGAAYVFRRTGTIWTEEAKLLPADGESGDHFGNNVAFDGDRILVGASWDRVSGIQSGSAYLFRWDDIEWIEEAKLVPSDGGAGDEFGYRGLAIEGDFALVGSYRDRDLGWLSGSAYLFRRTGSTWTQEVKWTAPDGLPEDRFGIGAALGADTAFVGASAHQTSPRPGAVYAYEIPSPPPIFTRPDCGSTIHVEPGETVEFMVAAEDALERTVTLDASGLPPNAIMDPALPITGNPVSSNFNWTTDDSHNNTIHTVEFTATNDLPAYARCEVTVEVAPYTLVTLVSFTAIPGDGQVTLHWTTASEIDNAGFYLLRSTVTARGTVRLHKGLIPARGDVFTGADYSYVDDTVTNGVQYEYTLVDVDLYGTETSHPPVRAIPNPPGPPVKLLSPVTPGGVVSNDTHVIRYAERFVSSITNE